MKYTLLEAVQLILSAMDSDQVNSHTDTVESLQVANILKSIYYDMASDIQLPENDGLFELDASGDSAKPTLMTLPTNATRVDWIKYDNKLTSETYSNFQDVCWLPYRDFITMQNGLRGQTSEVGEMTFTGADSTTHKIMYRKDAMPLWFTKVDNTKIIFNSYLNTEDTTLQKSKTQCYGGVYPTFTLSDGFTPQLDPTQFSLWLNLAKTRAFAELKQAVNQESASAARRQKIISQKGRERIAGAPQVYRVARYGRSQPMAYATTIAKNLRNGT